MVPQGFTPLAEVCRIFPSSLSVPHCTLQQQGYGGHALAMTQPLEAGKLLAGMAALWCAVGPGHGSMQRAPRDLQRAEGSEQSKERARSLASWSLALQHRPVCWVSHLLPSHHPLFSHFLLLLPHLALGAGAAPNPQPHSPMPAQSTARQSPLRPAPFASIPYWEPLLRPRSAFLPLFALPISSCEHEGVDDIMGCFMA